MNILFLDFDGVLNSNSKSREENTILERKHHINIDNLNNLKLLVEKENYQIVISSTWRKDKSFLEEATTKEEIIDKFKNLFNQYGWNKPPIIDITPNLSGFRGQEIAVYLDSLKIDNINYIILDDDKDFFLDNITSFSLIKLDRLEIRSIEEAENKSKFWSYQNLYQVNPETGLTIENINQILNSINSAKSYKVRV